MILDTLKGAFKSKTVWFNILTLITAVLALDELKPFISAETVIQVQAVVNILLRILTWQALKDKVIK